MDMSGRFVPMVDLKNEDGDTYSSVSDIPLQRVQMFHITILHRSRSHELGATPCGMFQVSIRHQIRPGKSFAITVSQCVHSRFTCSSWTSRNCSSGYTTSTRGSEWSACNGSTSFASSTIRNSCCRSSVWSGCEILWQETPKHTITTCRCKIGNSNMKQTRDLTRFSQEANQPVEHLRESLVTEVTIRKYGGEMSKYTTYVQNSVFMHCTWKTFRNNKINNMLDYQDWFRNCFKNLELLSQPLGQKSIDFDKEMQNFDEK